MRTAVVTASAGNYLPMARVMAESFRRHHPDVPVFLGLSDEAEGRIGPQEPFELVPLDELSLPEPRRLLFAYERREAAIAIKPYVIERVLDLGLETVVYIDADVLVLRGLAGLLAAAQRGSITLLPHFLEPPTGSDRITRELNILQSGVFNGGVLGVSQSGEARAFLSWWQRRVVLDCRHAVAEGLHYDQRWLDLVPSYFEDVHVYDDPTVNVAHWNLPERDLATCRLFHFSGYDPDRPDVLTRYSDRLSFADVPQIEPLFTRYRDAVLAAGWEEERDRPYRHGRFDNGVPIPSTARAAYRELGEEADCFGNPFATESPDSFFRWLVERSLLDSPLPEVAQR